MAAPQLQSALPVSTSQPNYVILAPLHTVSSTCHISMSRATSSVDPRWDYPTCVLLTQVSAPLPNAELSIPVLQQIPAISTNELVNVSSDGVAPLSRLTRVPNAARNSAEDSNSVCVSPPPAHQLPQLQATLVSHRYLLFQSEIPRLHLMILRCRNSRVFYIAQ